MAASPGTGRLLTVPLLLDGPLGQVDARRPDGRLLATYGTRGTLGPLVWEDDRTALITVYGVRRTAVVRCTVAGPAEDRTCERATRLIPTPGSDPTRRKAGAVGSGRAPTGRWTRP